MCKFAIPFVVLICLHQRSLNCYKKTSVRSRIMVCGSECTRFMHVEDELLKKKPFVKLSLNPSQYAE
ncbi:hypothetical protein C9218_00445 [Escherichia coli]|nr:hypothetical protein C9310_13810 [Escherichia coli]TJE43057.1 hypothetical protein C9218_00445 [Escherichia coli]TJE57005.1 hypothetical protein C9214_00735 [Escherichia coli]TJF13992.1 hypothetical protein C9207_02060 [Escherichia coli]TJF44398.1 hypothetical protein C9200_00735 [Escherichia coli]